jgi:hypothetical protein
MTARRPLHSQKLPLVLELPKRPLVMPLSLCRRVMPRGSMRLSLVPLVPTSQCYHLSHRMCRLVSGVGIRGAHGMVSCGCVACACCALHFCSACSLARARPV